MIPVSAIKSGILINDDCLRVLREIPDHSIQLILTDPPYNLARYSTGNLRFSGRSDINNDLAPWDLIPMDPASLLPEFKRILSPTGNIFLFCAYNTLGEYHRVFDPAFDTFQFAVWHKSNPVPNFRKSSFLNSCELIAACWNRGHTWHFTSQADMHNFIESPKCMGRERVRDAAGRTLHPAQKPLSVLSRLIRLGSDPGDVVLDCFSGVGSTCVAARELGRRYIGIEIDPAYHAAAQARLDQTEKAKAE